jgi:hypothetical protein
MPIWFCAERGSIVRIARVWPLALATWLGAAHLIDGGAAVAAARALTPRQTAPSVTLQSGALLSTTSNNGETKLVLAFPRLETKSAPLAIMLDRDETVASRSPLIEFRLIGEVGQGAVILTDTYRSKSGGLSYCQAGEEQFLRVLSISPQRAEQTLRLKLASCRENVELDDPGVEWNPQTATLTIHWLAAPGGRVESEDRTYVITSDGRAEIAVGGSGK